MSAWDSFKPSGDFPEHRMKFVQAGDLIVGVVTAIRFPVFENNEKTPELWITASRVVTDGQQQSPGEDWQVTASQMNLQIKLFDARPEVGDEVAIQLTGFGVPKPPRSAPKLFEVQVRHEAPASPWQQQSPTPQPVAAPEPFPSAPASRQAEPSPAAASNDLFAGLPPRQ